MSLTGRGDKARGSDTLKLGGHKKWQEWSFIFSRYFTSFFDRQITIKTPFRKLMTLLKLVKIDWKWKATYLRYLSLQTCFFSLEIVVFWLCSFDNKSLSLGPFIRGKIRRVLHKTRPKWDANFPYKRHISSKIRRDLVLCKTCLIFPRINGPIVLTI